MIQSLGLVGKSAFQLAKMSNQPSLVQTKKHFYNLGSVIDEVECRCGSQIPWVECYADDGTISFCAEQGSGTFWRYFSTGSLPLQKHNETVLQVSRCCWDSHKATFQDIRRENYFPRMSLSVQAYKTVLLVSRRNADCTNLDMIPTVLCFLQQMHMDDCCSAL